MARDTREVLIRIDLGEGYAEVWTEDRNWMARLERRGFVLKDRQGGGAWYRGAIRQVRIASPPIRQRSERTAASLAALAKAREAQRQKRQAVATGGPGAA